MSKKNKGKKNPSQKSSESTAKSSATPIADSVNDVKDKVHEMHENSELEALPESVKALEDDAKEIGNLEDKLSPEDKEILKLIIDDLKKAADDLKKAAEEHKKAKSAIESKSEGLKKREEELISKENEIKSKKSSLDTQTSALAEREKKLDEERRKIAGREEEVSGRELKIKEREDEAEAGFRAKQDAVLAERLAKFKKEYQHIIENNEAQWSQNEENRLQLKRDQEACRLQKADYEKRMEALREREASLKEDFERDSDEIRRECDNEVDRLKRLNSEHEEQSKKEISKLRDQIKEFEDIRAELGYPPKEVNDIISSLREKVEKQTAELQKTGSAEHQRMLEEQVQKYRDELESLTAEKNRLDNEVNRLRQKVCDNDGLKELNNILETHNKALKNAQKQLRTQVDELTKRDGDRDIFAEFKGIDSRCSEKYRGFSNSDGDLKKFINALGYRLTQYTPNLYYTPETLQLFVGGLAMSRLIILQGISGTGKTKLAQAFASIVGDNEKSGQDGPEQCSCIVPVQAGWRDSQDLLGYYNAFEKKFYERPFSKGVYAASTPKFKDRLFFLILDEMNLSHPEQYFADFISAMEQANSVSDPFEVDLLSGIQKEIIDNQERWPRCLNRERLVVPSNVWFIGTANHDETTMEFADKTYDRAHVMVMEKNTKKYPYNRVEKGEAHWSVSDLRKAFEQAQSQRERINDAQWVKKQLNSIEKCLKKNFGVSLGNRLDRQIDNFVPVVCAAGGSREVALDHLIATKIVRRGKITGLFGVPKDFLEELRDDILKIFKQTGISEDSSQTIKLLDLDIAAKERGA